MTRDQVIEKIKKLLRMKRGGTAEEVQTALALAAELARKHGVDLAGVDPDKVVEEPIGHIDATTSVRLGWEHKYASLVCQQFFNVTAFLTQDVLTRFSGWMGTRRGRSEFKIRLIGTSWDTQIALYVYHFLVGQFRNRWNSCRGRARNRQAFLYGMYHGICSKLDEARADSIGQNENALILIKNAVVRRNEYQNKTWPGSHTVDFSYDGDANVSKNAGFVNGRQVEIRTGLTDKGSAAPMLPPCQ